MKKPDSQLMERCFELAKEAQMRGDTAVGSLLTAADGTIIAEAGEQNRTGDLFAHSEILAIQRSIANLQDQDLSGCTLYTTNEPCFLCSFAIRQTSISRVIFVRDTPGIGGVSSNYPILSADDIPNWTPAPEVVCLAEW